MCKGNMAGWVFDQKIWLIVELYSHVYTWNLLHSGARTKCITVLAIYTIIYVFFSSKFVFEEILGFEALRYIPKKNWGLLSQMRICYVMADCKHNYYLMCVFDYSHELLLYWLQELYTILRSSIFVRKMHIHSQKILKLQTKWVRS